METDVDATNARVFAPTPALVPAPVLAACDIGGEYRACACVCTGDAYWFCTYAADTDTDADTDVDVDEGGGPGGGGNTGEIGDCVCAYVGETGCCCCCCCCC